MADTVVSNRGSGWKWFWGIFLSLIFIGMVFMGICFLLLTSVLKSGRYEYVSSGSGDKIAVVEVNGVIIESERTVEQIKKYREDKSIKAIIVRVDSPGGGVAASQEIYDEIKKTRDSGKIIVVSMGSIAASGGYYISCGSSLIVANPGTLTGSIGVIGSFLNWKDLADKIGIKENVIKSGELKDAGNPFRNMNAKDSAYFQDVVNNSFQQFLDVVSRERKIGKDKLIEYANGRVFTGLQAKEYGLIDSLGSFQDAVRITGRMAGIEGEPKVVKERKRFSLLERILGGEFEKFSDIKQRLFEEPILQYKFVP
jgi:protease-4